MRARSAARAIEPAAARPGQSIFLRNNILAPMEGEIP
jgi:hypothetical protein